MLASDRSYVQSINTYPVNTEVKTVKTFISSPIPAGFSAAFKFFSKCTCCKRCWSCNFRNEHFFYYSSYNSNGKKSLG
jgi:hypothetical protein